MKYIFLFCLFLLVTRADCLDHPMQDWLMKTYAEKDVSAVLIRLDKNTIEAELRQERMLTEKIPPGSLIKLFTALAFSNTHHGFPVYACPATSATDAGGCWDRRGHGRRVAIEQALAFSCNVYFRRLARNVDQKAFIHVLNHYDFDTSSLQALSQSEMQAVMVGLSNTWRVEPVHLLKAYSSIISAGNDGRIPSHVLERFAAGMRLGCSEGTSLQACSSSGLALLAKTSTTARIHEGIPTNGKTQGMWLAFYPDKKPEFAIMTFVASGRGATDAAPFGAAVLKKYLSFHKAQ